MDHFESLKKFKELLDMGIITQEEFDAKKAQILGLVGNPIPDVKAGAEVDGIVEEAAAKIEQDYDKLKEAVSLHPEIPDVKAGAEIDDIVMDVVEKVEEDINTVKEAIPPVPDVFELKPEAPAEPEVPEATPDITLSPEVPEAAPEFTLSPEVPKATPEFTLSPDVPEVKPEAPDLSAAFTPQQDTGTPDSIGNIFDEKPAFENAAADIAAQPVAPAAAAPKAKGKLPKPALIGIIVALVAVIGFLVFPKTSGEIGKIQGTWDLVSTTTDGSTWPAVGSTGGSLEVKGKKWTMEIHTSTNSGTFSGTIKFDNKQPTSDGGDAYFYDFVTESGAIFKAGALPDKDFISVSTRSYMDTDNCASFQRK